MRLFYFLVAFFVARGFSARGPRPPSTRPTAERLLPYDTTRNYIHIYLPNEYEYSMQAHHSTALCNKV